MKTLTYNKQEKCLFSLFSDKYINTFCTFYQYYYILYELHKYNIILTFRIIQYIYNRYIIEFTF